jgi:hypothetical protein
MGTFIAFSRLRPLRRFQVPAGVKYPTGIGEGKDKGGKMSSIISLELTMGGFKDDFLKGIHAKKLCGRTEIVHTFPSSFIF